MFVSVPSQNKPIWSESEQTYMISESEQTYMISESEQTYMISESEQTYMISESEQTYMISISFCQYFCVSEFEVWLRAGSCLSLLQTISNRYSTNLAYSCYNINIYTVKHAHAFTSIKKSPVLKSHLFLVLS